jgi:hypothetical protein
MLGKLEYEIKKLISLVEKDKEQIRRCCGGKRRLLGAFNRVQKALEIEKKKPNTADVTEDLAKIESLLEELAKEANIKLRRS